jgi:hypothetical protein
VSHLLSLGGTAMRTKRCDPRRCAVALFVACSGLVFAANSIVPAIAQSQPPAPQPASTPLTAASQRPEVKKATPGAATGTIKGRVVSDDGRPLTNASLIAQVNSNMGASKVTRSDAQGRFAFDELSPAVYTIFATAPGYVDPSIMTGLPSQWPRHLIGAQVKITMLKGGVITGTITNSNGDPVIAVPVRATLANGPSTSLMSFVGAGGASESDDRGVYRIFGLLPGQYIVSAGGSQFSLISTNGFDLDVPTYYPSANRDTAVPVSVSSGDTTTGIDIKYRGLEGRSISGVVLGTIPANASGGALSVLLSQAGTTSVLSVAIPGYTDASRAFNFNGVADGEYDLMAQFLSGPNEGLLVGTKRVSLRGSDLTGIELKLAPLSSITGTVILDAIRPENNCDRRGSELVETIIDAPRDEPKKSGSPAMIGMYAGFGGGMDNKGAFAIKNLDAGRYRLEIKLPTESWYVRAINLTAAPQPKTQPSAGPPSAASPNQKNTWQGVVTLKVGEQLSRVSVHVGQDAASLRGRVVTPGDGKVIPPGLRAHLIPADPEQTGNILRYSEATVNSDSSFRFTNVAPGHYLIFSRVEPPAEPDATSRPSAWDSAARAKLRREAEAAKTDVELKPCQAIADYQLNLKLAQ